MAGESGGCSKREEMKGEAGRGDVGKVRKEWSIREWSMVSTVSHVCYTQSPIPALPRLQI